MFIRTITTNSPRIMMPVPTDETASEGEGRLRGGVGKRKMAYDETFERSLDERGDSGYDLGELEGEE
jgi:hypothetical protein